MKYTQWSKVVGFISMALLFCTLTATAQFNTARLQATGLTCALCSKSIHQALSQLPFVDSVQPELKTSSYDLYFKNGQPVSVQSIRKAVEDAGFFIGSLHLQWNTPIPASNQSEGKFQERGELFQWDGQLNPGMTVQVINRGFVPEKEYKRLATRYPYLIRSTSVDPVIHLLIKK